MTDLLQQPNQVEDRVFVRDDYYEWLPGIIRELKDDQALVQIELPKTWDKATLGPAVTELERWVDLKHYYNHRLPMQNDRLCRDMAELTHLHEASILYQIKQRHALSLPYTRVGEIVVAVNPCQWLPSLYSAERQQFYVENFVKPVTGTLVIISFMLLLYIMFVFVPISLTLGPFFRASRRKKGRVRCVCGGVFPVVWREELRQAWLRASCIRSVRLGLLWSSQSRCRSDRVGIR